LENINEGNKKVFDSSKAGEHGALVPDSEVPKDLKGDDAKIYDLVVKRVLAIFYPVAVFENIERRTTVGDAEFLTKGRHLKEPGWLSVYGKSTDDKNLKPLNVEKEDTKTNVSMISFDESEHFTKPPSRIGDARLLSLMENAGRYVEDEDLIKNIDKEQNPLELGTTATRADTIENLIYKKYIIRQGNSLRPTAKAIKLIDVLKRIGVMQLSSVDLTARLERSISKIEQGSETKVSYDNEVIN
jgi:Topoisomerase IA